MIASVGIFLSCLLLYNLVLVENTGTVSINYYRFHTNGVDFYGNSCDSFGGECDTYFYFKYKECYSSFSDCGSETSDYHYSGENSGTLNIIKYYTTPDTFSGRVYLTVDTYDDDTLSADDGLVTYYLTVTFNYAHSSWSSYTITAGNGAYFEFQYRFTCNSYYYGNLCDVYCKARNDQYGHYECSSYGSKVCLSGWTGTDCQNDKNECTDGSHNCNSVTEYCVNVANGGGYTCSCNTGYQKSGSYCVNTNECYSSNGGCSHYCHDTDGSFYCSCYTGYYLASVKYCYDTNECSNNNGGCHHYCYNTAGSYYCDCLGGYELSSNGKTCTDINECSRNTDNCDQNCLNTVGSFTCSCDSGYALSSGRYCTDINECLNSNGGCDHTCTNTQGSFSCSCNTGYYLSSNGKSCSDTNECGTNNGGCGHYCTNTAGSFVCSCSSGYYLSTNGLSCDDINECTEYAHGCDHSCQNNAGSYYCQCSTGYMLASDQKTCQDINECNEVPTICSHQCTNSIGSYTCSCLTGYRLASDEKACDDIDECTENTNLCPSPKICANQPGSYQCDCLSGYEKLQNPERCVDINECDTGEDLCEQTCANSVGGYTCGCNTNYYLHNTYSCHIITFTVSIMRSEVTSYDAQLYLSIQFIPTASSVYVTNQMHTLDVSYGNGNYEVASTTSSNVITNSNLKPYRHYRFYVTTTGTLYSADSEYHNIFTPESTPSAPPVNLRVTDLTSSSIRIEWSAPPPADRNGIITEYTIQFKGSEDTSYTTLVETLTLHTLTNLNEFTQYQVRIAASTSVGISPFSSLVNTTTHEAEPNSPPLVEVAEVEARTISITLTPPPVDDINGIITEFQIAYYGEELDQTIKSIEVPPAAIQTNSIELSLTQLEENVVYHIKSRIWTEIGAGPYSGDIIQETLSAPPSAAPQSITFIAIGPTSLSIHWYSPPEQELNSDSISYRVQYHGNDFDTSLRTETTSTTSIMLSTLQEGELYIISVCSYNSLGNGPCEVVEKRTQEDEPSGPPQSVHAIALHDTALSIFWNSVVDSEANGFILGYEVRVNGTHHDGHSYLYSTNLTILIVSDLEEFELYSVQVRALNSIGAGPYSRFVEVRTHEDVPAGAPRELEGTAYITSILLTWIRPPAVEINGQIIYYEVHYVGTLEDVGNRTETINNTIYTLNQLRADETYLIQVRAYTSIGPGPYSSWIAIRTLEDAPSSPPQAVSTIAHSSTEIEVVWMPPDKRGQNGIITGYQVEISALSFSYSVNYYVDRATNLYLFTNLRPYRKYNIRIAAITQPGVGPYSMPITEQSLQDIPSVAPTSLMISITKARSVVISWIPVSDDAINGVLVHYELKISSSDSIIKVEPGLTNYTIYSLEPNTDYSVRIAAETAPGTGPYTPLLEFTTSEEAPSVGPTIDSINSITSTSFVVRWSSTSDTVRYGAITDYEIYVSEELTNVQVYDEISAVDDTSLLVTGLNEYTSYRVSVDAINSAGSSPSTIISVETAQSRPTSPPQYIYSVVNSTWIELSWFAPKEPDRNGIITGYEIQSNKKIVFANSTQYTLRNLEEAFLYTIQIRAVTIIGSGPFSTAINLTTLAVSPSAPPQHFNASAIAYDQILVTWEPVPVLEQNGRILQYNVVYWQYNESNMTQEMISTNYSTHQLIISSLKPYSYYGIYVVAINVVGISPDTGIITVRTLEHIPNVAPSNFSAHILSPSSVELTWNKIPFSDRNGVIIHQTITYQASDIDTEEHNINIDSEWTNFTFLNFNPSLTYQISIHESTSIGNGPRSYLNFTMPETNPSTAPENIAISNVPTGFHVEWSELPMASRNGEILQYQILLTVLSNGTKQGSMQIFNSTITEVELTNLTASTRYTIGVRAMTSAGYGPYSQKLEALTAPVGLECLGYFSLYEKDPCSNGATCKQKDEHDYTCDCAPGYDGVICQNEIDECEIHQCQMGNCVDAINNFTCICFDGYTGRFCEVEINECASQPCQNGGKCLDQVNSFQCKCNKEYLGEVCEYKNKCIENPCHHGTCEPNQDDHVCDCDNGYSGENCQYDINDCEDVKCENGGECLDGVTKFDCKCEFGYKGRYCQYSNKELTCESEKILRIVWPATEYSGTAKMPCQYLDPSFVDGNSSRECSKDGIWGKVNMDECIRRPFEILFTHLNGYNDIFGSITQINPKNITTVVQIAAYIVCGRDMLSPKEMQLTLNLTRYVLDSILELDDSTKRSLFIPLNDKFLCIFSTIINTQNIEFFIPEYANMIDDLFNALKIFSIINAEIFVTTSNTSCLYMVSDNIRLLVREIETKLNNSEFNLVSTCEQTNSITLEENSVHFPLSLTDALSDSNSKLGMSVVFSENLGQISTQVSAGIYSEYVPASTLVMVELATDIPNQLRNPIQINFALLESQPNSYRAYCVYWDELLQGWSTNGLEVYEISNDSITCSSTHLSTFMVLTEYVTLDTPLELILNYVIYGITGVSLICLLVAIILLTLLGRKLVENDIYIAQFSFAISMTFFVLFHLIALLKYSLIQDYCHVIAEIVYFCSLASTACFLAEGAAICFKFILPTVKRRIYVLIIIIGWIVPVPLAAFRISDLSSLGVKDEYCWLAVEPFIIWSMIEPILVIFIITIIALLVSFLRCCFNRKVENLSIAKFAVSSHLILAPFIFTPWALNIVNIYTSIPYYRWVYISMIALQGIIFLPLYLIPNKSILSKLRIFKNHFKKNEENQQDLVINGVHPSHVLGNDRDFNIEVGYQNPIYSGDQVKELTQGATHFLEEKLHDATQQCTVKNPPYENEYAELNTFEKVAFNPFSEDIYEQMEKSPKHSIDECSSINKESLSLQDINNFSSSKGESQFQVVNVFTNEVACVDTTDRDDQDVQDTDSVVTPSEEKVNPTDSEC